MKVLNGTMARLRPAPKAKRERSAMALMGGIFAGTALAALAVALVLEGPAADGVLPEATPVAAPAPR